MSEPTIDPTGIIADAWAHLQDGVDVVIVCDWHRIVVDLFSEACVVLGPVMARASRRDLRLLMGNGARLDIIDTRQAMAYLRGRRCIVLFHDPITGTDHYLLHMKALCELGIERPNEGT